MASDILSYNVVQDHEGIPIKGYRGLRPPGDLIYGTVPRPFCVETLDLYVSSPCAMGIISKSVAHACSGGARGLLRPNDQEYSYGSRCCTVIPAATVNSTVLYCKAVSAYIGIYPGLSARGSALIVRVRVKDCKDRIP